MTEQYIITRELKASIEKVWRVFSQEKHMANWWGPKGMPLNILKFEFIQGGKFHYEMKSPNGSMYGLFQFEEIIEQERIVYISSFADSDGNVVRAPFSENFPLLVRNSFIFSEKDGITHLKLIGTPIDSTQEEKEFFFGMTESMNNGFSGTFDQLEEYLEKV